MFKICNLSKNDNDYNNIYYIYFLFVKLNIKW